MSADTIELLARLICYRKGVDPNSLRRARVGPGCAANEHEAAWIASIPEATALLDLMTDDGDADGRVTRALALLDGVPVAGVARLSQSVIHRSMYEASAKVIMDVIKGDGPRGG